MLYAVKDTTLEAMGDAVRRYTLGEPELYNHQIEMRYDDGTFPLGYYQNYEGLPFAPQCLPDERLPTLHSVSTHRFCPLE